MLKKLLIASLTFSSLAFAADKAASQLEIDPATSKIVYVAKKVTGSHSGEVKLTSGHLNFTKNTLTGGEFVADMTSISNTDIAEAEYHKKFIDHMISEDFFDVKTFKTATFVIKKAVKGKADQYKITGDLTIKGKKAEPATFDAVVSSDKATATLTFDRTKYGIKYGSGQFFKDLGDKMINDEVQLDITLSIKK
jgi:polyisoprenoid-binding protein YceI